MDGWLHRTEVWVFIREFAVAIICIAKICFVLISALLININWIASFQYGNKIVDFVFNDSENIPRKSVSGKCEELPVAIDCGIHNSTLNQLWMSKATDETAWQETFS